MGTHIDAIRSTARKHRQPSLRPPDSGTETIGIDEISILQGHKYATLVYDLDRSFVVWFGEGKGRKTIDEFFNDMLSDYQKQKITAGSCDMSDAYFYFVTLTYLILHGNKLISSAYSSDKKTTRMNRSPPA